MLQHSNLLYNPLVDDCRSLLKRLKAPVVHHNFLERNRVADAMAKNRATQEFFEKVQVL